MKKVIVLLTIAFAVVYCSPPGQTEQTSADTTRSAGATGTTGAATSDTARTDTTVHQ
jgi:ABC-type microcin C transport system permease subunit YejB